MKDIIAIVGPRSVGKSSTGRIIAKHLGWKYIDLDHHMNKILQGQGDVFHYANKHGWDAYMKRLHKEIKELVPTLKKVVLDCGGGAIASEFHSSELIAKMLKKVSIIILILPDEDEEAGLKILFEREKQRRHFMDWPEDQLMKKVRDDYLNRVPEMKNYADYVVYANKRDQIQLAEYIMTLL